MAATGRFFYTGCQPNGWKTAKWLEDSQMSVRQLSISLLEASHMAETYSDGWDSVKMAVAQQNGWESAKWLGLHQPWKKGLKNHIYTKVKKQFFLFGI